MRYREFAPRKRNRDQQVDEVLPAVAGAARVAGALGGAALRTGAKLGGAALKAAAPIAKKVGSAVASGAKTLGTAAGAAVAGAAANKALFTPQGLQRQMGTQPGQAAQQGTTPPMQIKPGVKILHPGIGATKIKSIQGKDAVLDTQKELGQDIRVNQDELLAVLGQAQQAQK